MYLRPLLITSAKFMFIKTKVVFVLHKIILKGEERGGHVARDFIAILHK